jgi:iron complex outermembrane recepter protein
MLVMNKFRVAISTISFFLWVLSVDGQNQNGSAKGVVTDSKKAPIIAASITLLNAGDSSLVKIMPTDSRGNFVFESIPAGSYIISVTAVGYEDYSTGTFMVKAAADFLLDTVTLQQNSKNLLDVRVRAKKPPIQVKPDRMVLNVASSINASGSNALDLLRKSPWVKVDKDNNLSINSKNGVNVFIDGKPSNVSGGELGAILMSIPSANIEAIEVITNPSAKYPAAGNAGIINIRLKKNKTYGFNGNTSVTTSFGHTPKLDASANLNYRNKKYNIFGNYAFRAGDNRVLSSLNRIQQNGSFVNTYDQYSVIRNTDDNHNFKTGIDFFLSAKSTLGVLVNGNLNSGPGYTSSVTSIYSNPSKVDSLLKAVNDQERRIRKVNYNINYQYKDTAGRTLNIDADYSVFRGNTSIFQPNQYIDGANVVIRNNDVRTKAFTDIGVGSFKIDYEQNAFKGKLGFGIFANMVKANNDFNYYNISPGSESLNELRSRAFEYKEKINAAYINYSREIKNFNLNIGVRGEATSAKGNLTATTAASYRKLDTAYFNLFPSVSAGYKFNDNNAMYLNYNRRIDRPGYEDLNPFENPLDELTYSQGNTFVKPQFTDNIQLAYTFKQITATVGYSRTKDYFTKILDTVGGNKIVQTIKNIESQKIFSLGISAQFKPAKWWDVFANTNVNRASYKGLVSNNQLNVSAAYFDAYAANSFSVAKQWSMELASYFRGPSIDATANWKTNWSIDWGVQKKIFKGDGNFKLAVSDVFNTSVERGLINYNGTYIFGRFKGETRQLRLSFDYVFGNNSVKKARQRSTSADVQSRRLKQ